jgi:hypothetical protein
MVAEARARLSLDSKPFTDKLAEASDKVENKFVGALKSVGPAIAGAFTVGAVTNFIKSALSLGDEIDNLSNKLGLTAETVQSLKFTAEEAGIEFGKVEAAVLKLSRSSIDAQAGNEKMAQSFAAIGISVDELKTL